MQVKALYIERNIHNWENNGAAPGEYFGSITLGDSSSDVKVKIDKHLIEAFVRRAAEVAMFQLDKVVHENNANKIIVSSLTRLQEIPQQPGLPLSQDEE
jgi:hypothetical protein